MTPFRETRKCGRMHSPNSKKIPKGVIWRKGVGSGEIPIKKGGGGGGKAS